MQWVPELLQPFASTISAHPYLFIFVGLIFAGEAVLLPVIYLAANGKLDLPAVIAIAVVSTSISDAVWYYAGRRFPASALDRIAGRRSRSAVKGLERLFSEKGPYVLFLSKFVYGTRTAAQVFAGVHDMPWRTYLVANTLGVLALTLSLAAIALSVVGTARRLGEVMHSFEIAFAAFVLIAALGYIIVGRNLRRQWSR